LLKMSNIKLFENPEFGQVRVLLEDGEPLFCLADICNILELRVTDVKNRLEEEVVSTYPLPTNGGIQQLTFVNEEGFYSVVLGSRKESVKPFKKWVTSEVLPSIRKTGSYSIKPLTHAELMLQQAQVIVELEKRQIVQEGKIQQLTEENEEIRKDFDYLKSKTNNTPDFYSVVGYCSLKGISINLEDAKQLGKEASKICKVNGIKTGSLPDPRFGRIKTYPYRVLESVIESKISKTIKLN
jgi:toxin-antitoxin system, toxin component, bro family